MRFPILLTTILAFLAGTARAQLAQPPTAVTEGPLKDQTNVCPANARLGNPDASPIWSGWGGAGNVTNNARFQPKSGAGLTATDVPKLKLKWSFGIPGAMSMYSQPAVAFGRVFVGDDNGVVYSLDAKTGCLYWAYQADMFGRFAPIAAPVSGHTGTRYAILFVTRSTTAYALDAQDGKLLWKTQIRTGLNNLSATSAFYNGRLYVPMSGTETLVGGDLNYECCKSRGAVAALDANTGKVLWVHPERSGTASRARRKRERQAAVGTCRRFCLEHADGRCETRTGLRRHWEQLRTHRGGDQRFHPGPSHE